jgi:hypothetical protein
MMFKFNEWLRVRRDGLVLTEPVRQASPERSTRASTGRQEHVGAESDAESRNNFFERRARGALVVFFRLLPTPNTANYEQR